MSCQKAVNSGVTNFSHLSVSSFVWQTSSGKMVDLTVASVTRSHPLRLLERIA